jgi:hypothetical protein
MRMGRKKGMSATGGMGGVAVVLPAASMDESIG